MPPPPFLVHIHDLRCIKGMLAEKASEGDDVTKYFDSLRLEDTIALTTVLSIGHRSTETMDFTRTMSWLILTHHQTPLSGLQGFSNISWLILTHHQHTCMIL